MLEPVFFTFRLSVLAEIVLLDAANEPDEVDDSFLRASSQENHARMDPDHAGYRIIVRVMGFSCGILDFHATFIHNHAGMSNFLYLVHVALSFIQRKNAHPPRRQAFTLLFLFFFKEVTADDEIRYLLCT
ncbi:hypothetical protein B1B00_20500 [Bacillus sp. DSM 27956]|nr:hypothetical protein B1B00_20500 [Bacillus sp. DSM 27956]